MSESGALVNVPVRQRVGRQVVFTMRLRGPMLELPGRIVRCDARHDAKASTEPTSYDIAVQFSEMTTDRTNALADVIRALASPNNGKVVDMALRRPGP